jgi:hypothetical protein
MEKRDNDIRLTNNEVKDILGTPPKWILRWGNLILLLIIAILITGTTFIKHPQMVSGTVEIKPRLKNVAVTIPVNSIIDTVFVKDGASVKQGEDLVKYKLENQTYTVIAAVSGQISVEQILTKNTEIGQENTIINVYPSNQSYIVTGILPGNILASIYPGQSVGINIDGFSTKDFGSLTATVMAKPILDSIGNTFLSLKLNNTTNDQKKILAVSSLARGACYVVTNNKRLISWLLSK